MGGIHDAQQAVKAAHVGNSYIGVLMLFSLISDVLVTNGVSLFSSINWLGLFLPLRRYC